MAGTTPVVRWGLSVGLLAQQWTDDLPAQLAAAGVATVEIPYGWLPEARTPAEIERALAQHGVQIATVHAPFGAEIDFSSHPEAVTAGIAVTTASLELAAALGASQVIVHTSYEPIAASERAARLARARKSLEELALVCERTGVRLAVEVLPRTCLGNTTAELLTLLNGLPTAQFGICIDTNHLMDRAASLPDEVRLAGQRLTALHLSDYDGVDEKHWLPGQGVVAWQPFFTALAEVGYQGPYTYEAKLPSATFEERLAALQRNYAWLAAEINASSLAA